MKFLLKMNCKEKYMVFLYLLHKRARTPPPLFPSSEIGFGFFSAVSVNLIYKQQNTNLPNNYEESSFKKIVLKFVTSIS